MVLLLNRFLIHTNNDTLNKTYTNLLMPMIDSHDCFIRKLKFALTTYNMSASTPTPRNSVRTRSRHPKCRKTSETS